MRSVHPLRACERLCLLRGRVKAHHKQLLILILVVSVPLCHRLGRLGVAGDLAAVERLFSIVGVAFSDKRKSANASTLESIAFTKVNVA